MRHLTPRWPIILVGAVIVLGLSAAAVAHLPTVTTVQADSAAHTIRTYGRTVSDVIKESGIIIGPRDRVFPAMSAPLTTGMTVTVRRAFPIRLAADGRQRVFTTSASTVQQFLTEERVRLSDSDRVEPAMQTSLRPGSLVRVVRVVSTVVVQERAIPFIRISRLDGELPRGVTRVAQSGRPGLQRLQIAITTADGREMQRRIAAVTVVRAPQDHIVLIGTRRIIASRGEFAGKEVLEMEASAYAPWDSPGVNGVTATGLRAGYGVVAVDPAVIPLGSVLFIDGYGRAVAGDTGGAIKGRRIDLGFNTVRDALRFGRRPVRVYIVSTPNGAKAQTAINAQAQTSDAKPAPSASTGSR